MTAELGRQPWLIYGLMRTIDGVSPRVSAGNGLFTLLGFMGMYMLLGHSFRFASDKRGRARPGGPCSSRRNQPKRQTTKFRSSKGFDNGNNLVLPGSGRDQSVTFCSMASISARESFSFLSRGTTAKPIEC